MKENAKKENKNALNESLTEMGKELTERADTFKDIQSSLHLSLAKEAAETVRKYQETIAEVQERTRPYAKMMAEAQKQWEKQRELIMPAIEKMMGPMKIVQEAINKYPQIEKSFFHNDPVMLSAPTISTQINEDRLLAKLENLEKQMQELVEKKKIEPMKPAISSKCSVYHAKDGTELKFNKETGDIQFGEVKSNMAPGTQEFLVFACLLESSSHVAKYKTLLGLLYPGQTFDNPLKFYQVEKWALEGAIKKIKRAFGILPQKQAKNKDILHAITKDRSYRLILED